MANLTCGWGINDSNGIVLIKEELPKVDGKRKRKVVWICPYYQVWTNMLYRVLKSERTCYQNVSISEEWKYFSNFKAWMETQDWEGKHLDKDLLSSENKIYSPETCCFISCSLNLLIRDYCKSSHGSKGVSFDKTRSKWCATICIDNKNKHIGRFDTKEAAIEIYTIENKKRLSEAARQIRDERIRLAVIKKYNLTEDAK